MFTFPKHRFDATYIAGAFIAMLIGRVLNVYPLSGLLNIGRKNKISGKVQVRLFWLNYFKMSSILLEICHPSHSMIFPYKKSKNWKQKWKKIPYIFIYFLAYDGVLWTPWCHCICACHSKYTDGVSSAYPLHNSYHCHRYGHIQRRNDGIRPVMAQNSNR